MLRKSFLSRWVSLRITQNRTVFRDEGADQGCKMCVQAASSPVGLLPNKPVMDGSNHVFQSHTAKEVQFMGVGSIK